ncbi:MAG: C26 family cysteine hydrolase domain-containing family, partial [Spirochaetales bacterium]|nr:C26 family cysteine hydrolase domain-containing family [Spirochaetales bacterium]
PAVLEKQIALIQTLLKKLPVFGICLGHQLIALALGAKTYKMKFGHHGVNHPVRDELTGRVFVTSQNHGFAVDEKSLPPDVGIWFRNANDGTVEGIYHKTLPVKCAQFHPEACPGPHDSSWIFQSFLDVLATPSAPTV